MNSPGYGGEQPKRRSPFADLWAVGILLILCTVIWFMNYGMWSTASWLRPPGYSGDSLYVLANARAFETGEIHLLLSKHVPSLGAPLGANWNDFPITEELIYWGVGMLARFVGLFPAAHAFLFLAHLLALLSFYVTCRLLKYHVIPSAVGALLFSFSTYLTSRGFPHLMLTYCWHLPLCLLVTWWAASRSGISFRSARYWLSLGVGVVAGCSNPYYLNIFLQFLGLAAIRQTLIGRWRKAVPILSIAASSFAMFLLMNADTLAYRWQHGPNVNAVIRSIRSYERTSLLPIRMLLPARHRWTALEDWVNEHYDSQLQFHQQHEGSPYLGFVGVIGLLWLSLVSGRRILCGQAQLVPIHMWQVLWIILFFMCGGGNWILGVAFDFFLFRGGNRYAIVILVLALLYLVREASRALTWRWYWAGLAVIVLVVGLWDSIQLPRSSRQGKETQQKMTQSWADGAFVGSAQQRFPNGAQLFDFPVTDFPEGGVNRRSSYAYLRPYLFARRLKFSFGTDKGRAGGRWQHDLTWQSLPTAVRELERLGFNGILIHTDYLEDQGRSFIRQLAVLERHVVLRSKMSGLVLVGLHPEAEPVPLVVSLGRGWRPVRPTPVIAWPGPGARRSSGSSELIVVNGSQGALRVGLRFGVRCPRQELIQVSVEGRVVAQLTAESGQVTEVDDLLLTARPGETSVWLTSGATGAERLVGERARKARGFDLVNVEISGADRVASPR